MLQGNYDRILKIIADNSGLNLDEVERKIEAKRAKLSGLISKEGAAQIIASELGISFDKQKLKISELLTGMKKVSLTGKIILMNRVVEYNKNGRSGKIGSFTLADATSNIRVVLWDANHITLIENGTIKEGEVIEINGGDVRNNEVHLTGFADIKTSSEEMNDVQTKIPVQKKSIAEMQANNNVSARAFIVQIFGPTFFNTCPECGKRILDSGGCAVHGNVIPKRGAILTLIVDDGSSSIRAVLFSEQIKKIASESELESTDAFMAKRKELLGKEVIIDGGVRKNKISDNLEIFVNDIHDVNIDELIQELEK